MSSPSPEAFLPGECLRGHKSVREAVLGGGLFRAIQLVEYGAQVAIPELKEHILSRTARD